MSPKQITERAAAKYGVPFWLLWGIAGAESTWGEGGTNLFGLLDAAEGANVSDWNSAANQAAKTLAGLAKQYGSWGQAVQHYSGYSYDISHPRELAAEKGVHTTTPNTGGGGGFLSGVPVVGDVAGAVEGAIGAGEDVVDFTGELVSTLLNFRKLGELGAKATAWFIKLVGKAIWDYVIAPMWHWNERAVSWYFENFFGKGAEEGSGVGYIYRANAGIVTLMFWGLGYGILWTGPDSGIKPVDNARESYLGRTVKSVEGAVKKRKLVKPSQVKSKTPKKPTPKASSVQLSKTRTFSANRNRPVKVQQHGGGPLDAVEEIVDIRNKIREGNNDGNTGRGHSARGSSGTSSGSSSRGKTQKKQIILPPGVKKEAGTRRQKRPQKVTA